MTEKSDDQLIGKPTKSHELKSLQGQKFDEIIYRTERTAAVFVAVQLLIFFWIVWRTIAENEPDRISSDSVWIIVLGVVGVGIAKSISTKTESAYHYHFIRADIISAKILGLTANIKHHPESETRDNALSKLDQDYRDIMLLRGNAESSVTRINRVSYFLWFSELSFITVGTLYAAYGKSILELIHGA